MSLSPEQKQAVADWIAAGDNLATVQKKLAEQFKLSLTYRDVRFLVDDLGLELQNAAPKTDASDVTKAQVPPPAEKNDKPEEQAAPGGDDTADALPPDGADDAYPEDEGVPADAPAGTSTLTLEVDRIMRPGTVVSGSVTFSDGVSGKWGLDQYGRLMLDTGQPGYQPSAADIQAFQRELQLHLQRQGY